MTTKAPFTPQVTIEVRTSIYGSWAARVTKCDEFGRVYETDVIWERGGFPDPYSAFQQAALALSLARPKLAVSPVWPGSCENDPYLVRQALGQIKAAKESE